MHEALQEGYTRDDVKEIVTQISSGLMWQDDAAAESVTRWWLSAANYNASDWFNTSGYTATWYCTDLALGGYNDWYLPSKDELLGIIKSSVSNPAVSSVFQHTASDYYWSSTTLAHNSAGAMSINFSDGNPHSYYKADYRHVRCVRAGQ